jgi:hypothetical protein
MRRATILSALSLLLGGCSSSNDSGSDGKTQTDGKGGWRTEAGVWGDGQGPPREGSVAPAEGGGTADTQAPAIITPDTPPSSDVTFTVHSQQKVKTISRFIYGMNSTSWGSRPKGVTLDRLGGNRWTAYNWENNASNAGTDYENENDAYLGGGSTPGEAVRPTVASAHSYSASAIVTIPMLGYVSADKSPAGDVNQTSSYLTKRFYVSKAKKGSTFSTSPDTTDSVVYEDEFVNFLEKKFPNAATDTQKRIFYSLDNEPDLWASTHPRLRGDSSGSSGTGVTYAELLSKSKELAAAIKAVAPKALVLGPVSYGWEGFVDLQSASDAGGRDFLEYYLKEMSSASTSAGVRLLDLLDLHWYSEATGGGTRITGSGTSSAIVAARVQAPRSLWDTSYTETSWITQYSTSGPIGLIPRLQKKIDTYYPGTKISLSEYSHGGESHISGGVAQADTLGIFGREGIYAATVWLLSSSTDYISGAFEMFRSYDGAGSAFGDTSISAATSDVATATVYASVDAGKPSRMLLVCVNKSTSSKTAGIAVSHSQLFTKVGVYTLTSSSSSPAKGTALAITKKNAFQYTMPAMSVSTLVLEP